MFNVPKSAGCTPMPAAYVQYDTDTGAPLRGADGRVLRVPNGEPGLLLSPVTKLQPFDGYTDPSASEKKLVRNAFRDGDCWFNTGDVMSPQGMGHAAFVDRLGDTFRWKGENVATTQVERALGSNKSVEECTVFGVEIPRTGGRAGMAAVKLRDGADFDGKALAETVYSQLPVYALPLFLRIVDSMEHTTTFQSRKVDLREQAYGPDIEDPLYVLAGRDEGYVRFSDDYPDYVATGKRTQVRVPGERTGRFVTTATPVTRDGCHSFPKSWSYAISARGATLFRDRWHPWCEIEKSESSFSATEVARESCEGSARTSARVL